MIKKFNDVPIRNTAVIYGSSLEQIKEYYEIDPDAAGELAISIIEVAVTGQMSTSNPLIKMALANFKDIAGKNGAKYDKQTEAKREARAKRLQLPEIAAMLKEGKKQNEIAKILGKAASSVSEAVKVLKTEYSEMLTENSENPGVSSENLPNNSDEFDELEIEFGENSDEFGEDLEKFGGGSEKTEFLQNSGDSENSPNSGYDNVNVNVNDNVNVNLTRDFPSENSLGTISLSELNRMGARFKYISGNVVEIEGTKKRFKLEDDVSSQF